MYQYNTNSFNYKLQVEDVEGYPRNICFTCKDNLDIVYDFINKYKESHKVLQEGLVSLKCESNDTKSDYEADQLIEIDLDLKAIKSEPKTYLENLEDAEQLIDFLPLDGIIEETPIQFVKVEKKPSKKPNKYETRTEKVASSILEGEFAWTGETWW